MRPVGLPHLALLASLTLPLGAARADDDVVDRVDSKNIVVTQPKGDAAVAEGAKMTVEGTIKVAEGAKAPDIVIAEFTGKVEFAGETKDVQFGSYGLRLGDEENEYGLYRLKDGTHGFRFNVEAPRRAGEYALTVLTIEASGDKVFKERSKPIKIQVR